MIRVFPLGFTCPDLVQPARSLELAQDAVNTYARNFEYQRSLGVALYANGRYEEARAALLEALELELRPDPTALFFLAMTESELGHRADARRTYDRAVARVNETWPESPDLVLLKREAGKAIGTQ